MMEAKGELDSTSAGSGASTPGNGIATGDILNHLPVGIVCFPSLGSGRVGFCNDAACRMFRIDRGNAAGRTFSEVFSGDALLPLRRFLAIATSANADWNKQERVTVLDAQGSRRVLGLSLSVDAASSSLILVASDITDRARAEEEQKRIAETLALREESYRTLTENSSDLISSHGYDGIILFASAASEKMLGIDCESMVGHSLDEYVLDEDRTMFIDFMMGLQMGVESSTITVRMRHRDGHVVWVETRANARKGRRGGVELTCATRDISERKFVEDRMRALQSQLASAIESMDAGIVMYDKDDRLVFCNRRYRFFYPELSSLIVPGAFYPDIITAFIERGLTDERGLGPSELKELRISDHHARAGSGRKLRLPDGKWLNISDHPTHDGGVVSLMTDVTDMKNARDDLSRERVFLRTLLDAIPDLIAYRDLSGRYLECNPSFCRFVGRTRDQVIGRMDEELFPANTAELIRSGDPETIQERKASTTEISGRDRSGRALTFELVRSPVLSPTGEVSAIVGIARDISERSKTQAMLKAESSRLATLIRNIEGGVLVMDQSMRILLANDGFVELFGLAVKPEELFGKLCDAVTGEGREAYRGLLRSVFGEGKLVRGGVFTIPGGRFLEYDFIPIDIGGGFFNYLWHFKDISSRRLAEIELQQRDTLLSSLAMAVRTLLAGLEDFDSSVIEAFRIVAEAAGIDRIVIFQNDIDETNTGSWTTTMRYRWSRTLGAAKSLPEYARLPFAPVYNRWLRELSRGVTLCGEVKDFEPQERPMLEKAGFGSLLVAPMFIGARFWGMMFFDSPAGREWSSSDRGIMRMVADCVGLAFQRTQVHEQLNKTLSHAEAMAEEARKANQAKTDFLASMSHEIRTPLNGVVGYCNLMRNTQLTPRQSELLHGIDRSTEMLLALINDILDLSKISAGLFTLDNVAFCPALAVEDVIAALGPKAAEKGLGITFECEPKLRQVYMGDERRLKQILLNLVGNAIKFTEKGGVHIRAGVFPGKPGEAARLDFSVRDTGIGISCENQTKLFRPFSQAENDIGRRYGGTGLGLAICRQLAGLMGGNIGVDSIPGRGSEFYFHILCQPSRESLESRDSSARNWPSGHVEPGRPLSIVIADDNIINQEVMSLYIGELGYTAKVVSNGAEALHAVMDEQVDLVLMDIRMPGMDGIEATQAIREWEARYMPKERRPVRIVALTADAVKSDSEKCLAIGMDDYLCKPVDPDQIEAVIHRLFP